MKRAIPKIRFVNISENISDLKVITCNGYDIYLPGGITFENNEVFRISKNGALLESVYIYKDGYIIPYNNDELVKYYISKELSTIKDAIDPRKLTRGLYDPTATGEVNKNGE